MCVSSRNGSGWLPASVTDVFLPLQNPHKFFPDERFGDESPLLTVRQSGRCRVNSTPTAEALFTELDSFVAFHPPLPPPPPPYHPPATPIHNQFKVGWKQRVPSQHPSRSFSYPCNHSLFHSRTAPKAAPPVYLPSVKAAPPDCTNTTGLGRQTVAAAAAVMAAEKQVVSIIFSPPYLWQFKVAHWEEVERIRMMLSLGLVKTAASLLVRRLFCQNQSKSSASKGHGVICGRLNAPRAGVILGGKQDL